MLPRHDHEQEGYIEYNTFYFKCGGAQCNYQSGNSKECKRSVRAGLPDSGGVYGGYRIEMRRECIHIDIYTDKVQYNGLSTFFTYVLTAGLCLI